MFACSISQDAPDIDGETTLGETPASPENNAMPPAADAKSLENDTKSLENDAKSLENDPKSAEDLKSAVGNPKSAKNDAESPEDDPKSAAEQAPQNPKSRPRVLTVLLKKLPNESVTITDLPTLMQHAGELSSAERGLVVALASRLILEGIAAIKQLEENNKKLQDANKKLLESNTRLTRDLNEAKERSDEKKAKLKTLARTDAVQQQAFAALKQQVESLTEELHLLHEEQAQQTTLLNAKEAELDEAKAAAGAAKAEADAAADATQAAADAAIAAEVPDARSVKDHIKLALSQVGFEFDKRVKDTEREVAALKAQMREATEAGCLSDMKAIFEQLEVATEAHEQAIAARHNLNSMSPDIKEKLILGTTETLFRNAKGGKKNTPESDARASEQRPAPDPASFAAMAGGKWPELPKTALAPSHNSCLVAKANALHGIEVSAFELNEDDAQGHSAKVTVTFPEDSNEFKSFTEMNKKSAQFQKFCRELVWPSSTSSNMQIIEEVNKLRRSVKQDDITSATVYFCARPSLASNSVTIFVNYKK